MNTGQLGGSLAAILVLAGLAWALKLGRGTIIADRAEAMMLAEDALSGFAADRAWISREGRAAVVIGRDRSIAVLCVRGANPVARRLTRPLCRSSGNSVVIVIGERLLRAATIDFADADEATAFLRTLEAAGATIDKGVDRAG